MNWTQLSRTISHALRHEPWLYDLEVDEEGWVHLEALLAALRTHCEEWQRLSEEDIIGLMEAANKQRFEVRPGRIRALYGHSTAKRLRKEPSPPPEVLFHGTSPANARVIREEGLKPMARQYVHLSVDRETALQVGRRKSPHPVILEVAAREAHNAGVAFFKGNEQVWLADRVPPSFIGA